MFADQGKSAKDLLTKNFVAEKEKEQKRHTVTLNSKTTTGTKLTIKGEHGYDDKLNASVKLEPTLSSEIGLTSEFEFKSDNTKATFKLDDSKLPKGLSAAVAVEGNPHTFALGFLKKTEEGQEKCKCEYGASLDVKFKKDLNDDFSVGVNGKVEHKKTGENEYDFNFAVSHSKGVVGGARFNGDVKNPTAVKVAQGVIGFNVDNTSVNFYGKRELKDAAPVEGKEDKEDIKPAEKEAQVTFGVTVFHNFSPKYSVAADVSNEKVTAAIVRTCGDDKIGAKLDTKGQAGFYFQSKVSDHTKFTGAASFDGLAASKGEPIASKFTIAMELD